MLSTLLPLAGQTDRVLSPGDGNFELEGKWNPASSVTLRFRSKAGLGYRLQLARGAFGRLDDPGRRTGTLAGPASPLPAAAGVVRLMVNGPRIQLEWNGKPVWEYLEKEAGVPSSGAVQLRGSLAALQFRPLPATPPSFAERYGPGLGDAIPAFTAVDQTGATRTFASLRGPKGLWILFVRSADW